MIGSVMLVSQRGACGEDKRQDAKGKNKKASRKRRFIIFNKIYTGNEARLRNVKVTIV